MTNQGPAEDEAAEAERKMVKLLTDALAANVDREHLPWQEREGVAEEFLEFTGRLVTFLQAQQPSPAKAAAVLYVVNRLGLDKSEGPAAQIILTLVQAMDQIAGALSKSKSRSS